MLIKRQETGKSIVLLGLGLGLKEKGIVIPDITLRVISLYDIKIFVYDEDLILFHAYFVILC